MIFIIDMIFKAYRIEKYYTFTKARIDNDYASFDLADFVRELKKDNFYNIRIRKDDTVVFFGDLDHYYDELNTFINALKTFSGNV